MNRCHIHDDGILLTIQSKGTTYYSHKLSIREAKQLWEQLGSTIDAAEIRTRGLPPLPPIPKKRQAKGKNNAR